MPANETDDTEAVSAFVEIGTTGLHRAGGFITEEFLTQLAGRKAVQVYREMSDNDPIVGGILFAIDKLIRNVEWTPKSDDEELSEFIGQCMNDMSVTWPDFISEAVTMLPYGWSMFETVYKRRLGDTGDGSTSKFDDGRIGWRKFGMRSQDSLLRWDFDENGGLRGMWQTPAPDYKPRFIPIQKALLFRTTTHKGNPEGRSILRNAYRPWYFKKRIEEIEAIGIERDLAGYPLLYLDPEIMTGTTPEAKQAYAEYKEMVRNIRRDRLEGAVLPSVFDDRGNQLIKLELMSTGGARAFDTSGIIGRYQQEIAMTVLADFILLGHESVGSFALSADKTELFAVALGSWLKSMAAVFNNYAIPRLLAVNGMPLDRNTILEPGDIDELSLETITTLLTALDGMGASVFPNDELAEALFTRARLPYTPMEMRVEQDEDISFE